MKNRRQSAKSRKRNAILFWITSALFLAVGSMEPSSLFIGILFAYLGFRSFALARYEREADLKEQKEKEAYDRFIRSLKRVEVNIADADVPKLDADNMPELVTLTREADLQYKKCSDFIVIDVETTGRDPKEHRILEFAAVKFSDYEPTEYITALIDSDETGKNAMTISKALPSLIDFIGDCDAIVAHNLSYSARFLYENGFDFFKSERRYYDTRGIAKKYFDLDNYKLKTLCGLFSIHYGDQRGALHDCIATGQLYKEILTDL